MRHLLMTAAFAAVLAAPTAHAQVSTRVWLNGDSTVRAFRCDAKSVDSRLTGVDTVGSIGTLEQSSIAGRVKIQVKSLDCANGTMNDHLRDALKEKAHPVITIAVQSVKVGPRKGAEVAVEAMANLTLSGVTRPIVLTGSARETEKGLVLTGEHRLLMTDYGVKPPSLMLGTMKVKDAVTVSFELSFPAQPKSEKPVAVGAL